MLQETKKIRKEIYDFIKSKGVELSDGGMTFIGTKIKEHAEARVGNIKELSKRYTIVQENVGKLLKKSDKFEKTQRIVGQIEALKIVSSWLNSDAE